MKTIVMALGALAIAFSAIPFDSQACPSPEQVRSAVIKVVADRAGLEQSSVDAAKALAEHGIDELDFIEVFLDLEKELDIPIDDEAFSLHTSVGSVVEAVGRACK